MAPRRAAASSFAASTRCTMYWSVHQYQRPTMGGVSTMPSQGNSGSSRGFHMSNSSPPTASRKRDWRQGRSGQGTTKRQAASFVGRNAFVLPGLAASAAAPVI